MNITGARGLGRRYGGAAHRAAPTGRPLAGIPSGLRCSRMRFGYGTSRESGYAGKRATRHPLRSDRCAVACM
jgi:hypothetical protein